MKKQEKGPDIFPHSAERQIRGEAPLAARMRPRSFIEFVGQEHIVGEAATELIGKEGAL